jgi:hypothetical protein
VCDLRSQITAYRSLIVCARTGIVTRSDLRDLIPPLKICESKQILYIILEEVTLVHHTEKKTDLTELGHEFEDTMVVITGIILFLIVVGIWYLFLR